MSLQELYDKILVVDDDLPMNMLLQTYLKSGFRGEIMSAYNGVEAVKKCLEYKPALVFMDIRMPDKNGVTATRELRAAGFDSPILVISCYGEMEKERCLKAGADAVLSKPISRDVFLDQFKRFYKANGRDSP